MKKYPEHEKITAVKAQSQEIGEFLEWLQAVKKCHFGVYHEHDEMCEYNRTFGEHSCGMSDQHLNELSITIEQLLAEYFKVDLKKISEEKDEMYDDMRRAALAHEFEETVNECLEPL